MKPKLAILLTLAALAWQAVMSFGARAAAPENAEYYLARWELVTENGMTFWRAPTGTIGLVDLRPLASTSTWGFFATTTTLGGDALYLGTDINGAMQAGARAEWETRLGLAAGSIASASIVDVLAETLTEDADSSGTTHALPLMPTHNGVMEIHLGGHSLVWSRPFAGLADRGWTPMQRLLWSKYRELRVEAARVIALINGITLADLQTRGDPNNPERDRLIKIALALKTPTRTWAQVKEIMIEGVKRHARRVLGAQVRKYKIDWRELVPPDLRDWGEEAPETTISDAMTGADGTALNSHTSTDGLGWTWALWDQALKISSNTAIAVTAGTYCKMRAQYDLSSDDMLVTVSAWIAGAASYDHIGTCARGSVDAQTFYNARAQTSDSKVALFKWVAGDATSLATPSFSYSAGQTVGTQADGSSISAYYNGVSLTTQTDTAITGNTRSGITMRGHAANALDDFSAADLLAATPVPVFAHHYQMMRGN